MDKRKQDHGQKAWQMEGRFYLHSKILYELLRRDRRTHTLAEHICQLYEDTSPQQDTQHLKKKIQTLRAVLSEAYGIPLPEIPDALTYKQYREDRTAGQLGEALELDPRECALLESIKGPEGRALRAVILEQFSKVEAPGVSQEALIETLVENVVSTSGGPSARGLDDEKILDQLRRIISVVVHEERAQGFLALSHEERKALITQELHHWVKESMLRIGSSAWIVCAKQNWVAPGAGILVIGEDGTLQVQKSPGRPPPAGEPPTLTITIDLSKVHLLGTTRVADYVGEHVQQAMETLQKMGTLPKEWAPFPSALAFLRTTTWDQFQSDLRRFDLHMQHGLSFRAIAQWESGPQKSRPIPRTAQRTKIGKPIVGEDSVEDSVNKIYEAINRTKYKARRRKVDTPAQGLGAYYCSTHPLGDCPGDCPNLTEWMGQFNAIAPTSTTGKGKEIVSLDESQERRRR